MPAFEPTYRIFYVLRLLLSCGELQEQDGEGRMQQSHYASWATDGEDMARAFELAYEVEPLKRSSSTRKAITVGSVRLYSSEDPSLELDASTFRYHFSPIRIYNRLRHADRRDTLYFDAHGDIYRPGLEFQLSTKDEAYQLSRELAPLTPAHSPRLSPLWRAVIRAVVCLVTIRRRIRGEKVLAYYSAEDRTYFGSVYCNARGCFFSVHGRKREDIEWGAKRLISLLTKP
jgi:hypothetical protein